MPNKTPRNYVDVVGPTDVDVNMTPSDGFANVYDVGWWILNKQKCGTPNLASNVDGPAWAGRGNPAELHPQLF